MVMSSEILINSAIGETRFALMEQGRAVEIRLFRDHAPGRVGAIYHGRITSLSKAFQAAFVDLGEGLTGFLPLSSLPKQPGRKHGLCSAYCRVCMDDYTRWYG